MNSVEVFFEVHRGLPREGPGNRAATWRALDLAAVDPAAPSRLLDLACGPGMQTLDLAARLPRASILALDLHQPFLDDLARRLRSSDAAGRITPVRADMTRLPVAGAVDVIWCEGAAYLMGVAAALAAWQALLRPAGVCAFTEAVWLGEAASPDRVRDLWKNYPAMTDVPGNRTLVREAGLELLGDFVLPADAWWDDYYGPMSERLALLEAHYRGRPEAQSVLAAVREEIDVYRDYAAWYGYSFFVARKP